METKLRLMAAMVIRNDNTLCHEVMFHDGWKVEIDRSEEYPEQLRIKVRNPNTHETVSEMLVWIR